jgi:pregnancy-associated plasma protein-A
MTQAPLTLSWRTARVATAALALTAAVLTVSGSSSVHAAPLSAPVAAAGGTTAAPCLSKGAAERVRADSQLDGADPNELTLAQTQQAEAGLASKARQRGLSVGRASLPKTTIDVYVHVITTDQGKGGVSTKRIKKQISVLNKAYGGKTSGSSTKTPFTFKLKTKNIDRTRSSAWYSWSNPEVSLSDEVQAKTALHRGGRDDLNIYLASLEDGLLGYSSFPFDASLARDGVVILDESVPGGSAKGYNKGDTMTHEVGHWLGLYHTFQNGCSAPGDQVDDTPYQADGSNIFSCSTKLDTCLGAGKDPVHNFMSYGDDTCLNRFTKGQVTRMAASWQAYRAPGAGA